MADEDVPCLPPAGQLAKLGVTEEEVMQYPPMTQGGLRNRGCLPQESRRSAWHKSPDDGCDHQWRRISRVWPGLFVSYQE